MTPSQERFLESLDREWAELAGWEIEDILDSRSTMSVTYWKYDYLRLPLEPRFSRVASECFGVGGPWEWLVAYARHGYPSVELQLRATQEGFICELWRGYVAIGETPFEAITRCAIAVRKSIDG